MTKKNWLMAIVLLALCAVYVFYFTEWFKPKLIQISSTARNIRRRHTPDAATVPVLFKLNASYQITDLKVVPLLAWQTNRNILPLWHLVSDSNSVPTKAFSYGMPIRGMKPALAGVQAEPLQPDVTYHMIITAGEAKGEHDFATRSADSDAPSQ